MAFQAQTLPKFSRQFKKFYSKEQDLIRQEIKKVLSDPGIGERKKGALANVQVHKFKVRNQLYLLAYEVDIKSKIVYLYAIATHENFYEALQRYLT